jgi:hypothetical protein
MAVTYEPIATPQTVSGSATNTITFSSIPGTYTDIVAVINVGATSGSSTGFGMRFNSDSATNYSDQRLNGDGSSASATRSTSQDRILQFSNALPETASIYSPTITHVFNYANATTYKSCLTRCNSAATGIQIITGTWRSTSAITSITFYTFAGNFSSGSTFALYGIKAA